MDVYKKQPVLIDKLKNRSFGRKYDFLDLGCKSGGSIGFTAKRFGGKGLGVDFKKEAVQKARDNGYDAIHGDVFNLKFRPNKFRYVSMIDFLEHLASEEDIAYVLERCKKWAKEFFFIHHPSFEDVDYLKKHGLKLDWTDWSGHTAGLTIKDFKRIFKVLGLNNHTIKRTKLIADSSYEHIVPLSAPTDTLIYDKSLGPKKLIKFTKPIYGRVEMLVQLK